MSKPIPIDFLNDVANHKMEILHEQGLYRHLRFQQQPKRWNMWFDLITWPGCLTIKGDMGCWTFSRVDDMLTFFRSDKLEINADYWAEKSQHGTHGGRDGAKVWDQDTFETHLLDQLVTYFEDEPVKLAEITPVVKEEIFQRHDGDGPQMMRHAAYEFSYEFEDDREPAPRSIHDLINSATRLQTAISSRKSRKEKFQFDGMDLPDGMVYSYHFIWCLYAIVWGIQQYDAVKVEVAA